MFALFLPFATPSRRQNGYTHMHGAWSPVGDCRFRESSHESPRDSSRSNDSPPGHESDTDSAVAQAPVYGFSEQV